MAILNSTTELWKRRVRVEFGVSGGVGKQLDDFAVSFEGKKTSTITPNECTITVYNLNEDSIAALLLPDTVVTVYTGYGDSPQWQVLFSGDVLRASPQKRGPDMAIVIEAGDAQESILQKSISIEKKGTVLVKSIIADAAKSLKIVPPKTGKLPNAYYANGFVFSGAAGELFDTLADKLGCEVSVQNGVVTFLPTNAVINTLAKVIGPESGMIGTPRLIKKGLEVVCLLDAGILPGSYIFVVSRQFSDYFKVRRVDFKGGNYESSWEMKLYAVRPEGVDFESIE